MANQAHLAENVRRLAGMHLVSMERLAEYVGVSRQSMQKIVAHEREERSMPKAETALKLADAFAVPLNALYSEPLECLQLALEGFPEAPIAHAVEVPVGIIEVTTGNVTPLRRAR